MTDHTPSIKMNVQPGYADIEWTNPKTGHVVETDRLNPRELIALRDLLNKHFPVGSEP